MTTTALEVTTDIDTWAEDTLYLCDVRIPRYHWGRDIFNTLGGFTEDGEYMVGRAIMYKSVSGTTPWMIADHPHFNRINPDTAAQSLRAARPSIRTSRANISWIRGVHGVIDPVTLMPVDAPTVEGGLSTDPHVWQMDTLYRAEVSIPYGTWSDWVFEEDGDLHRDGNNWVGQKTLYRSQSGETPWALVRGSAHAEIAATTPAQALRNHHRHQRVTRFQHRWITRILGTVDPQTLEMVVPAPAAVTPPVLVEDMVPGVVYLARLRMPESRYYTRSWELLPEMTIETNGSYYSGNMMIHKTQYNDYEIISPRNHRWATINSRYLPTMARNFQNYTVGTLYRQDIVALLGEVDQNTLVTAYYDPSNAPSAQAADADADAVELAAYKDRVRETLIRETRRHGYNEQELNELLEDVGLNPRTRTYRVRATFQSVVEFDVRATDPQAAQEHIRGNINANAEGAPVRYDAPVSNTRELTSMTIVS